MTGTAIDLAELLAVDAEITSGSGNFGVTDTGFAPKPMARILAEKLALAQRLFGGAIDLGSGSALRKICEITALEEARLWASLAATYDNGFVVSARGSALSALGAEIGLPRPFEAARGHVEMRLIAELPGDIEALSIPRGARLLTPGGHHVATSETARLTPGGPPLRVAVEAFYPGPEHNLDPGVEEAGAFPQRIDRVNPADPVFAELLDMEAELGAPLLAITHSAALAGGEIGWPDDRYRRLLLGAPRSVWTIDAIEAAVARLPGVRQVQVHDEWGGLDIDRTIFGNFNFAERLFSAERDLANPYYLTVLIAPTPGAIWEGAGGLRRAAEVAIEDMRPISIFPRIEQATPAGIGVACDLVVRDLPLPSAPPATVNASATARALKARLLARLEGYVDGLGLGEPVRAAQVTAALMAEPGIADVRDLRLLLWPPGFDAIDLSLTGGPVATQVFECGDNIRLGATDIPVFVDDPARLNLVLGGGQR